MRFKFCKSFLFVLFFATIVLGCKKEKVNDPPVANAGQDQIITLPRDTITLTGSGTDANGTITGYLWSQVSGPMAATITNDGFASALFSDLIEGTYVFQLTVYDNAGAVGSDMVSVTVEPAITLTEEFAPAQNPDEIHFLGNNFGFDQSDPGAPEFGAVAWTVGGTSVAMRGAFKFDLSGIPANAVINSAKLTLFSNHTPINGNQTDANYGSNNSMFIQRITTSWNANTVGWTNQPSTTTQGQISIPSTGQNFLDLVDVDVTALVAAMVNSNANYGFMIKLQNESAYNSRIFCSSKYAEASRHPKLVVTYTQP